MISSSSLERSDPESAVLRLAEAQYGVVSRGQAVSCGLSKQAIGRRTNSGKWEIIFPATYRLPGSPASWRQELAAACLWSSGCASYRSAARLLGVSGLDEFPLEVTTEKGLRSLRGIALHRAQLKRSDIIEVDGIPCTTSAKTLIDLASCVGFDVLERVMDELLRTRKLTIKWLRWRQGLGDIRGKPGTDQLRTLVEGRLGYVKESPLERRMAHLIEGSGLPRPRYQYEVCVSKDVTFRIDAAYPEVLVAIETDGYAFHSSKNAFQNDRLRDNQLLSRGWIVLRFTWDDFASRAQYVTQTIKETLKSRGLFI